MHYNPVTAFSPLLLRVFPSHSKFENKFQQKWKYFGAALHVKTSYKIKSDRIGRSKASYRLQNV